MTSHGKQNDVILQPPSSLLSIPGYPEYLIINAIGTRFGSSYYKIFNILSLWQNMACSKIADVYSSGPTVISPHKRALVSCLHADEFRCSLL